MEAALKLTRAYWRIQGEGQGAIYITLEVPEGIFTHRGKSETKLTPTGLGLEILRPNGVGTGKAWEK